MKKNILLFLSLISVLSFSACSNTTNPNPTPSNGGNNSSIYEDEEPYVVSLELLQAPTRTSYIVGELFDPSGILIKANWSHTDPYGEQLFEDDIKKNDLSHWTPNGPLKLEDKLVTVFYEGKSLDIPITVDATKQMTNIEVSRQSVNHIVEGETLKVDSLKVIGTYTDGEVEDVTTYTVKMDGKTDVTDTIKTGITGLSVGKHEFEVSYLGKTDKFYVQVLEKDYASNATRIEADNLISSGSVTADTRNYVEQTDSLIAEDDSGNGASNGKSLSRIFLHTTVKLHYYSDVAGKVSIMINGASTSRDLSRKIMTDIYLEDVMSLKINGTESKYDRGAYFKGLGSSSQWFKWNLTYLGTFDVKQGDNIFELYMFDEQAWPNSKGSDGGATLFNLDYFDFIKG